VAGLSERFKFENQVIDKNLGWPFIRLSFREFRGIPFSSPSLVDGT